MTWTPENEAELRHMRHVLHMSYSEIAKKLGCTTSSAAKKARRLDPIPDSLRAVCQFPGCGRVLAHSKARFCTPAHRFANWVAENPEKARNRDGEGPRQDPLQRTFRLRWDASVVIGPDMPAPPRYYAPGETMLTGEAAGIGNRKPFRDDLAAIADKGSPGTLSRPVIVSPSVSVLAGLG